MAEKARDLGHEYFALTDHSPRLTIAQRSVAPSGCASSSTSSPSSTRSSRRSGSSPASRSTSSKTARSTRTTSCSPRSTSSSRACTRSCGWTPTPMTRRMVARDREPARRHPRPLHRPAGRRPGPPGVGSSTPTLVFERVRAVRHRGRDQLPARAARPAQRILRPRPSRRAARSRSTPTRTRPTSSTGRPTAPTAPPSAA